LFHFPYTPHATLAHSFARLASVSTFNFEQGYVKVGSVENGVFNDQTIVKILAPVGSSSYGFGLSLGLSRANPKDEQSPLLVAICDPFQADGRCFIYNIATPTEPIFEYSAPANSNADFGKN